MADAPAARKASGKRVGGSLYIHASALSSLDERTRDLVNRALGHARGVVWNVAKVVGNNVSLLLYEDFDQTAFPALLASVRVDVGTGQAVGTDYRGRENPPVLHRKELLFAPDDPRRPTFAALTRAAEDHGLFQEPRKIGSRKQWAAALESAGLEVQGQRLVPKGGERVEVARHRTAIVRRDLSQPMQLAVVHGILTPGSSVFDYGCGQGDDVAALQAADYEAFGWDPHHAPDGPRRPADVVNLGFVLNVVEDRHERAEILKAAYSFTRRALSVAVMVVGRTPVIGLRPFRDGYLTARGTFQKYFGQQELRDFIEETVGEPPVALAPGIFAIFRDKEVEQEVLLRRRSRIIVRPVGMRRDRQQKPGTPRPTIAERLRPELEQLWLAILEKGRPLNISEISPELLRRLQAVRVSPVRAMDLCLSDLFDQDPLRQAATARREDLLVHFALTLFPGAPRYTTLPRCIKRDVKAFFGSHAAALQEARLLLFSAGKREAVRAGVEAALGAGLGAMRDERTFRFHVSVLTRLPAVLRVLVGCAGVLQGGVEGADFVDIKLDSPRLVLISCADASSELPVIVERTRVDLGRLIVEADEARGSVLYLKGRFLPADDPGRERQIRFDEWLLASGLVTEDGRGPRADELEAVLPQLPETGASR